MYTYPTFQLFALAERKRVLVENVDNLLISGCNPRGQGAGGVLMYSGRRFPSFCQTFLHSFLHNLLKSIKRNATFFENQQFGCKDTKYFVNINY